MQGENSGFLGFEIPESTKPILRIPEARVDPGRTMKIRRAHCEYHMEKKDPSQCQL